MVNTKGHMISLVTRMLIVAIVIVFLSVVTEILLIKKFNRSPMGGPEIVVLATLAILISYLYWRPRYKAP